MRIDDVTAVVTGGGSGLGAATARALAAKGAHVALIDVNRDAAERLADELGGRACIADVASEERAAREAVFIDWGTERPRLERQVLARSFGGRSRAVSRPSLSVPIEDDATYTAVRISLAGSGPFRVGAAAGLPASPSAALPISCIRPQ